MSIDGPFHQNERLFLGPNVCLQCVLIDLPLSKETGPGGALEGGLENGLACNVRGGGKPTKFDEIQ